MAADWTCASCGVTVSFKSGAAAPTHPEGWVKDKEGWQCLSCQRSAVADAASSDSKAGLTAARRRALTEFELLRDPTAPDQEIARRVKCSTAMIPPVRAALVESGKLSG